MTWKLASWLFNFFWFCLQIQQSSFLYSLDRKHRNHGGYGSKWNRPDSPDFDVVEVVTTLTVQIFVRGSGYGLQDLGNGIQDDGSRRKFSSKDSVVTENRPPVIIEELTIQCLGTNLETCYLTLNASYTSCAVFQPATCFLSRAFFFFLFNALQLNPLYPITSVQVHQTVPRTFPKLLARRVRLTIKSFLSWQSFPLFSLSSCLI